MDSGRSVGALEQFRADVGFEMVEDIGFFGIHRAEAGDEVYSFTEPRHMVGAGDHASREALLAYEFGGDEVTVYTPSGIQSISHTNDELALKGSLSTTYFALDANYITNAEYIELPLIIRYKLIDQKISLDVMSGFSTNFLVKNSTSIISNNQELWSGENVDLNSILYGATFGLGVNYNFYQNLTFNLEPAFKYSILPENSVFSKYPYSFAVFAGFSYRFK